MQLNNLIKHKIFPNQLNFFCLTFFFQKRLCQPFCSAFQQTFPFWSLADQHILPKERSWKVMEPLTGNLWNRCFRECCRSAERNQFFAWLETLIPTCGLFTTECIGFVPEFRCIFTYSATSDKCQTQISLQKWKLFFIGEKHAAHQCAGFWRFLSVIT